ncbi:MAG: peptide chain release factor N(5)-glutamine methyltransferase [Spirochaetes bacterium]|nr:peptide chain release factor N(5)-glutamine methyltransferase [Spirochaetota bacterium]
MNISEAIKFAANQFENAGITTPVLDAQILLSQILQSERYKLLTNPGKKISAFNLISFNKFINRRLKGEPIAYITGKKEFYSIDFKITKDVLIPRPDTERIVEYAEINALTGSKVLDIGTGSGAIAIALKKTRPDLTVFACDISKKALKVARQNAENIIGNNAVAFVKSDLFQAYKGMKFDMILSNPPYLNRSEKDTFQKEIFFEPGKALYANNKGREILLKIISETKNYLNRRGSLILEFGNNQDEYVRDTGLKYGFKVTILKDYTEFPRYAVLN